MSASRRLLGIDVGERRIGVAVSEGSIAVPLDILAHETDASDIERIAALAHEREASAVVVGLPVSMSGAELAQAKRVRRFGEALSRRMDVPVVYHDERLSSAQVAGAAGRRMPRERATAVHPARRRVKPRIDDLAATVVLQAYIDAQERAS